MSTERFFPKFLDSSPKLFGINVWVLLGSFLLLGLLRIGKVSGWGLWLCSVTPITINMISAKLIEPNFFKHYFRKGKKVSLYDQYK